MFGCCCENDPGDPTTWVLRLVLEVDDLLLLTVRYDATPDQVFPGDTLALNTLYSGPVSLDVSLNWHIGASSAGVRYGYEWGFWMDSIGAVTGDVYLDGTWPGGETFSEQWTYAEFIAEVAAEGAVFRLVIPNDPP
jgi:hypothetical protein